MERSLLKEKLQIIKNNEFKLQQGETTADYINHMLQYIGDLDFELRDHLIYPTMLHWIEINRELEKEELSRIFDLLLSEDYAFFNIEKKDDTSVYKRSFSTLTLNPILCVHEEEPFLTDVQMNNFRTKMIDYIEMEQDFRGYDHQYGWAHALAHWSDTNFFLAFGLDDPTDMNKKVLATIQNKMLNIQTPLAREEDERLATNIVYEYIDEKKLSVDDFKEWLEGFNQAFEIEDKMHKYTAKVNIKHFLRSIYFRMKHLEVSDDFVNPVLELEKKFNGYLY